TDERGVDERLEFFLEVEHERAAAGHARAEIFAGASEDDDRAIRHVFAAVVAEAFDDGDAAGVAHAKAFARAAAREQHSARRAIHHGVADDRVFVRDKFPVSRRAHDDLAAAHALADVIVRLAFEHDANAARQKR